MSKLNPTKTPPRKKIDFQLAGGYGASAAKQGDEALLRRATLACLLWEDMAYETGEDSSDNIAALIPKVDPERVALLAHECRHKQKLRHVPLFIACEMLKHDTHRGYVRELLPQIITRPDMLTDFLAIYWKDGKKPLRKQAQRGLAEAFQNFNEYQFAKYDRDAAIKLRDVMFLTHPKAKDQAQYALFDRIAKRTLKTPDTWEVSLSAGKDKKETWERLIEEGKLGGLAFLRNLRNMKQAGVNATIIRNGMKSIRSQMLLPLNFWAAAKHAPEFRSDINEMMLRTYSTLPKLGGHTIFVVDVSGSMTSRISGKSEYSRMDVAAVMATLALELCESCEIWCTAGNDSRRIHATEMIAYPSRGFDLVNQIRYSSNSLGGGGIFTRQCLEHIQKSCKKTPDRIVIFSDSQDCDSAHSRTPKPFGVNNYIVDVSANKHGVNYKGAWTAEISGWSENFLTFVAACEGLNNSFDEE